MSRNYIFFNKAYVFIFTFHKTHPTKTWHILYISVTYLCTPCAERYLEKKNNVSRTLKCTFLSNSMLNPTNIPNTYRLNYIYIYIKFKNTMNTGHICLYTGRIYVLVMMLNTCWSIHIFSGYINTQIFIYSICFKYV